MIRRLIAETGLGAVYEARHRYTDRTVAIKRTRAGLASAPRVRERLLREARFLGGARHPGIVAVLDAGESPEGSPYMVMEMLEGRTLDGLLATRGALSVEEAVRIGSGVCEALAYAHARGVVHRDIKPSNVFLPPEGVQGPVKVIDFGIASVGVADASKKLTLADEILGTAEYMAPEQLLMEATDHRCDLYAVGVTLFECLTGEVPFPGSYPEVLVEVSTSKEAPSPRQIRPAIPEAVAEVVTRALARSPGDRFQDAVSFARALEAALGQAAPAPAGLAGQQRRRFRRAAYVTPIRVFGAQAVFDGRSEDISEGGLLLLGPQILQHDTPVRVRFASPLTGAIVTVAAMARWVRSARGGKGAIGVEFAAIEDSLRAEIARYVVLVGAPDDAGA